MGAILMFCTATMYAMYFFIIASFDSQVKQIASKFYEMGVFSYAS
jgi:hypothetical protein